MSDFSTIANIIGSVVTFGATITIGVLQIRLARRQTNMTEEQGAFQKEMLLSQDVFMREQSELMREQSEISKRDAQLVAEQQAAAFLRDNYAERGLVPLAVMAEMYGAERLYNRQLYRDFLMLSPAAQDFVLSRLEFARPELPSEGTFWGLLSSVLRQDYAERFGDFPIFYEDIKYIKRAFEYHGSQGLPQVKMDLPPDVVAVRQRRINPRLWDPKRDLSKVSGHSGYTEALTDVLSEAFHDKDLKPLGLMRGNLAPENGGVEASYFDCLFAGYFASYLGSERCRTQYDADGHGDDYFGSPAAPTDEEIKTMEDLFLWTLFEVYTNLVIPRIKNGEIKVKDRKVVDHQ